MHRVNRQLKWEEYLSEDYAWHQVKSNIQPATQEGSIKVLDQENE
jgi:hypothetical protein